LNRFLRREFVVRNSGRKQNDFQIKLKILKDFNHGFASIARRIYIGGQLAPRQAIAR